MPLISYYLNQRHDAIQVSECHAGCVWQLRLLITMLSVGDITAQPVP